MDVGDRIPDIAVTVDDVSVALSAFIGRPLVLYFYPKDDTAGCTREAQDFSAALADFAALGTAVLGTSRDTPAKHAKFAAKYALTVPLASDVDGVATEVFGVWVEKSLYGRRYMGIDRSTFLFDAEGRLARAWRKVKVPGHVVAVLAATTDMMEP